MHGGTVQLSRTLQGVDGKNRTALIAQNCEPQTGARDVQVVQLFIVKLSCPNPAGQQQAIKLNCPRKKVGQQIGQRFRALLIYINQ